MNNYNIVEKVWVAFFLMMNQACVENGLINSVISLPALFEWANSGELNSCSFRTNFVVPTLIKERGIYFSLHVQV